MELIGPYIVGCALLVVAGTAKFCRPADTARALSLATSIPLRMVVAGVRWGALAEAGLGVVAVIAPGPVPAALVAASYAGFAAFIATIRSTGGPLATCGCFGTPDTPATWLHVVLDAVICACAATVAAARYRGTIGSVLASQPLHGVPLVLASGVSAWLAVLAMSGLPKLRAARQLVERPPVGSV